MNRSFIVRILGMDKLVTALEYRGNNNDAARPDVIPDACNIGISRLESLKAYTSGGPVPGWYEEYKVSEAMERPEAPEGGPLSALAAAMSNRVIID